MTKRCSAERFVPLTGGMTVALLIVATVVGTARADENICTQCMNYWYYIGDKNGVCNQYPNPSPQRQQCLTAYYMYMCWGEGGPCKKGGQLPVADCGSDDCSFFPEIPESSVCKWECWNRICDDGPPEKRCFDRPKKCHPEDPTYECSECKCDVP
jgi:hypothetical protein